ncbi:hypothetical protein FNH09_27010 [Streptomyces adustus]|uniref:Uncharacterized protein n=1 Tax=Streptomyces adustus TaxID=1609272 RepID=A0A5N8VIX4_9ACTN|nr:hypothetical protein [Streptomyces adustus]
MGQVECGRIRNQQGSCAAELRRRTPPSTAREPCPLRTPPRPPIHTVRRGPFRSFVGSEHPGVLGMAVTR